MSVPYELGLISLCTHTHTHVHMHARTGAHTHTQIHKSRKYYIYTSQYASEWAKFAKARYVENQWA